MFGLKKSRFPENKKLSSTYSKKLWGDPIFFFNIVDEKNFFAPVMIESCFDMFQIILGEKNLKENSEENWKNCCQFLSFSLQCSETYEKKNQ